MLVVDWPVPNGIKIAFSQRHGGVSLPPYDSLNLGLHVGDDANAVAANRQLVAQQLALPQVPYWLEQVHSTKVVELGVDTDTIADGSFSRQPNQVCVVMTADCLPVLLTNKQGTQVAAVHAGWRGLCDGIIEQAIAKFDCNADQLIAYLGPCIGPQAFEVGAEVKQAFIDKNPQDEHCFISHSDKYLANLSKLAENRLTNCGVKEFYTAGCCTFSLQNDYFSYRRDGITGRMASFIWIQA